MTPDQLVSSAQALIRIPEGDGAGLWPRTAAVLGRQAIESALRQYWRLRQPGLEHCSSHAQLLCLVAYLNKKELARETADAWATLSRACHHHPYELSPTAEELSGWLSTARTFAEEVKRQSASGS
ncbi:MAG: hypothetical protein F4Z04_04540 [Acidobacteria bacterium]|nr:hypothetical protein [Acidobacteriota bacterium]